MMSSWCSPTLNSTGSTNLGDFILLTIQKFNDHVALIDSVDRNTILFSEISQKSLFLRDFLIKDGIKSGDVVAIMSKNSIDYAWHILGTLLAGAVCNLVPPTSRPRELIHTLTITKPVRVIAPELDEEQFDAILSIPQVECIFKEESDPWVPSKCLSINSLRSNEEVKHVRQKPSFAADLEDTAFLLSSSGSTGLPKAVCIKHRNAIAALHHGGNFMRYKGTALGLMPFYHAYGLGLMLMALCEGSKMVVMPSFKMSTLLSNIENYKISHLYLVPSLISSLAKLDFAYNRCLASVREVFTGAGPVVPAHQQALLNKLNKSARLYHSYGMTETTFVVLFGETRPDKPSSPGKLVPGVRAKIIYEDGTEAPPLNEGQLLLKGPTIFSGYLSNPEATQETFDQEKWLKTGDLAFRDEDGYFYIIDRIKDIIKFQGYQVSPIELESVLIQHPAIQEVAVTGLPHEIYGEVPAAFIVKSPDFICAEKETDDIHKFVKKELSSVKQLRGGIFFVESIPKSPNGKICRRKLVELPIVN